MTTRPTAIRFSAAEIAEAAGLGYAPTPEQAAVIESPAHQPVLVIAGAGSGKTETMAARVLWLVANGLVTPDEVLGLTFTRKAASELGERLQGRLARLRASGLWAPPDGEALLVQSPTVSTYHAYAGRLVSEHGLRLGVEPDTRLLTEAAAWQVAHDALVSHDGDMSHVGAAESSLTAAVVDLAGELAEHLRSTDETAAALTAAIAELEAVPKGRTRKSKHPLADELENLRLRRTLMPVVDRYRQAKRRQDAMDFADQMQLAAELARRFPDVGALERLRFKAVLLDEFQDTSEAQLVLLAGLFRSADGAVGREPVPVTAVGDPHQSIYGWRGASANTLERFREAFASPGPARVLPLSTSWRNDQAILGCANVVAAPLTAHTSIEVGQLVSRPGAGPGAVAVARAGTLADEARLVARWLTQQRSRRVDGRPPKAAVLCRKRSLFEPIVAALREADVPYEVVGLGGLLLTPEVEDLMALLHVVADPARGDHLMRLLTGPRLRLGIADLDALWAWARQHQEAGRGRPAPPAPPGGAVDGMDDLPLADLEPESADRASLVEALDALPPENWVGPDGQRLTPLALDRLQGLAGVLRRLRSLTALTLPDLVGEAERAFGLDIEVVARAEYTPEAARAHLDAFTDVAAQFAAQADRATLGGFLAWTDAAIELERGLEKGIVEPTPDAVQVMTVHAAKGLEWDVVAIPGLVESTFPAHNRSRSSADGDAFIVSEPEGRGWLAGVTEGGIPYALRGDRDGLPMLDLADVDGWDELAERWGAFRSAVGAHALREERRLAYVALTRARRAMLLSAHVWSTASTPRITARFLDELHEAALAPDQPLPLARLEWAPMPVPDTPDAVRPELAGAGPVAWPVDRSARQGAPRAAALAVQRSLAAESPAEEPSDPAPRLDAPGRWAGDLQVLLAERDQGPRAAAPFVAPAHLSTSNLVALARDAERFRRDLRRPVPQPPAVAARQGTEFHAWVEQFFGRAAMVDILDLPGSADEPGDSAATLNTLKQNFLASPWAARVPLEIETTVETTLAGVAVRGRVDAVFADDDGGYTVVDWKTGPVPTGPELQARVVQLAAYRLAWSRLKGIPAASVRGAFFHALTGVTLTPDLPGEDELLALLSTLAPQPT